MGETVSPNALNTPGNSPGAVTRVGRALVCGLLGTVLASGTHYLTLSAGVAMPYLAQGRGLPETPSLPLTPGGLALHCLIAALPMLPVLAACSYGGRLLIALGFVLVWALGGEHLGQLFAADFGNSWGFSEPLRSLYLRGSFSTVAVFVCLFVLWTVPSLPGDRQGAGASGGR
ncbi:hypothetical protein HOY34_10695 [Xinfangfangia sp. D13-10-4-6]|uniref:hypothetical protein n=1 Tax=Pseudogemmobacter hezensis TaxID=2737662 RepID=UPI001554A832|nr:hypothetical protein [Pseudogemmobacter hezensis]NPD15669.1 hypothetical protein [Pseudogemmobacter hezensis]